MVFTAIDEKERETKTVKKRDMIRDDAREDERCTERKGKFGVKLDVISFLSCRMFRKYVLFPLCNVDHSNSACYCHVIVASPFLSKQRYRLSPTNFSRFLQDRTSVYQVSVQTAVTNLDVTLSRCHVVTNVVTGVGA